MKKLIALFLIAGSLALFYLAEPALACPSPLHCSNFTEADKRDDCRYVNQQNIPYEEKQEVLCILWEQTYVSHGLYQINTSSVNATVSLPYHEIDNGSFILASKMVVLAFINYVVFCFGKSSIILRLFDL